MIINFQQLLKNNYLINQDIEQVEKLLKQYLDCDLKIAHNIAHHLVDAGGKRIRPILLLLVAKLFNYKDQDHILLAMILELLHTATLLHDDVVDISEIRRSNKTANCIWSNSSCILVGDLLHARAFNAITQVKDQAIVRYLASVTEEIVQGELLQLLHCFDITTDETIYFEIINKKTAKLFELAAKSATMLTQQNQIVQQQFAEYGKLIGMSFQLIDDILDYSGNPIKIGKNIGDDLREGKPSLLIIYALQHAAVTDQQYIKDLFSKNNSLDKSYIEQEQVLKIYDIIKSCGAINYAKNICQKFNQQAKKIIIDLAVPHDKQIANILIQLLRDLAVRIT